MDSFGNAVHVLDLERGTVARRFSYGQWPTAGAMSPDGRFLYVVHEESDQVAKVDTETDALAAKIAVGNEPVAIVVFAMP
jgi:YVTN family beta-propeller protein